MPIPLQTAIVTRGNRIQLLTLVLVGCCLLAFLSIQLTIHMSGGMAASGTGRTSFMGGPPFAGSYPASTLCNSQDQIIA